MDFKTIKERIDAREFVKKHLGEPQKISGETWKWTSPFRNGDSDPSLCVTATVISDFGDENFKGKDIFSFLARLKNITEYEALKTVAKDLDIDIDTQNTKITPTKTKTKKVFALTPSPNTPDEIYAMVDNVAYTKKPTGDEIGKIKNRIQNLEPELYTLEQLKQLIATGHTIIPAGIKSQADWKDGNNFYQVFMVDIDNVKTVNNVKEKITIENEEHVTVEKIVKYCEEINLVPTFIYNTFSHTEQQHKLRLVYILDVATQNQEVVKNLYNSFKTTFKDFNMDTAPTSIATMFFGGKSIAFESNTFYKIEEVETAEESLQVIDNYELNLCSNALSKSRYVIDNGTLFFLKSADKVAPISNFVTYVTEKLNFKNGQDTETLYKVKCAILDEPNQKLPEQIITVEQYQKFNFILGSSWDKFAIMKAGSTNTDKLREVTQLISRKTMEEKNIYTHTGFTKINGKTCFLYHGGAIGDVEGVDADLSTDKLQRYCFTDKTFDTKQALQRSFSILDLASLNITIPLLATTYLAPLTTILSEEGIHADYILYVQGKTGTRKSSTVSMILSHFGKFDRDHFPCSFRDTINSIEKISFITKDTVNVVDDYNPETNGNSKSYIIEKLFGAYGDRIGRTRMAQNGKSLKANYKARGLCIVTGETVPDVPQSRIARAAFVNIKEDSIDLAKLTELQNNTEELAFAMMKYIEWIIANETEIRKTAKAKFNELRAKQDKNVHGRTSEIAIVNTLGFTFFTQFLLENNVIDNVKKQELDTKCYDTLTELVERQSQEIVDLKPTEMFYNALEQLFATNTISVVDYHTGKPVRELSQTGQNVGCYDRDKEIFYFYPTVIYNAVQKFYASGNKKFPINAKSLWKYLFEEGSLYRTDERRYTVTRTINHKSKSFVAIYPREIDITPGEDDPVVWEEQNNRMRYFDTF